ncbi:MAG: PEGA domain-containing protein [Prevotella sp.]|nr:PEGA domain-containing protein [Prevotella sp.]
MAQISVANFRLLESDQTANTFGTEKIDDNGEKAALIKIVTPETELTFDPGYLGIVERINKDGEIWLYVPRRSRKITITSKKFGKLTDYQYPTSIEGAQTYEMLLDIGTGRYVTITTSPTNSDVTVDGEYVGKSPIYNRYMNFGSHTIFAKKDRYEGTATKEVLPMDSKLNNYANVQMSDISDKYGDVTVSVDNNAEIYFENKLVGIGTWTTQLREGSYAVETKKTDCDSVKTTFQVVAQQKNEIKAASPTPHMGYLRLVTRPSDALARYYGSRYLSVEEANPLPIGTYQVDFSKKGYQPLSREFSVRRNETTTDTITLNSIEYVASTSFYIGAAYTVRSLSGITGVMGFTFKNHDFQAHYTLGTSASDPVYCYSFNEEVYDYQSTVNFKQSSFGLKYGYQFVLKDNMNHLAFTPQIGVNVDRLTCTAEEGTNVYADGASATCLTIGAKLLYAPAQHFYLFIAPEFDVALQKDENFQRIAEISNITAGGFLVNVGLMVSF